MTDLPGPMHPGGFHPWDAPSAQNLLAGQPGWTYAAGSLVDPADPRFSGFLGQQEYYAEREMLAALALQQAHPGAVGAGAEPTHEIVTIL